MIAEEKKKNKIQRFTIEIGRLWQKKTKVIPVVIGTLSAIPKHTEEHLNSIGAAEIIIKQLQKQSYLEQLIFCDGFYMIKPGIPGPWEGLHI